MYNYEFSTVELLQPLNLPPYPFKITDRNGRLFLFDDIRKKEILITPEEWVRQHFVKYLIHHKKYPKTLIKIEGGLKLHGMNRRSDILVHNRHGIKVILVECKAPGVKMDQQVLDQAARYNMVHKVPLLVVTNGLVTYFAEIDFEENSYRFTEELPDFAD